MRGLAAIKTDYIFLMATDEDYAELKKKVGCNLELSYHQ